jgi:hypothetical protein
MEFCFQPLSYFLKQDGRRADKVGYFPRPRVSRQGTDQHAPYCRKRVCPVRGCKRATPQASIHSFLLLSRNRSRLKTQKFAFHKTRKVPCECGEIVFTIRPVKCCKEKHPKTKLCNQLAGNLRHQQRRCRQTIEQFPFVSKSNADQYTLRVIQLQERHQLLLANF